MCFTSMFGSVIFLSFTVLEIRTVSICVLDCWTSRLDTVWIPIRRLLLFGENWGVLCANNSFFDCKSSSTNLNSEICNRQSWEFIGSLVPFQILWGRSLFEDCEPFCWRGSRFLTTVSKHSATFLLRVSVNWLGLVSQIIGFLQIRNVCSDL